VVLAHLKYMKYVLTHKWFVFWAGIQLGGIPIWRLIVHDWTKFTPAEWTPYVNRFFGNGGYKPSPNSKGYNHQLNKGQNTAFDEAWKHHWQNNPHHPEYWNKGTDVAIYMPVTYTREMVADWCGAGFAQGKPDIMGWYQANDRLVIHERTRQLVEHVLNEAQRKGIIP
jgi:hypothetical protein